MSMEHHVTRETGCSTVQVEGRRRYRRRAAGSCSKCFGQQDRVGQRYCKACHATYERERRKHVAALSEHQQRQKGR